MGDILQIYIIRYQKLLIFISVIAVLYVIYTLNYHTDLWNQKLIFQVETPEGIVSGSSVVRVVADVKVTMGLLEVAVISHTWRGEARVVELPNQKYLIVLLGHPVRMAQYSFIEIILGDFDAKFIPMREYYPKLVELRAAVPLIYDRYPVFVTFGDLDDPASVKLVDPDDLATTFVAGYVLKSVTLEITDEETTNGYIQNILNYFW